MIRLSIVSLFAEVDSSYKELCGVDDMGSIGWRVVGDSNAVVILA